MVLANGSITSRHCRLAVFATAAILTACHDSDQPAVYSLGGTVSGLADSGLVLAYGSRTLAISAGASDFTFGAVLTSGTAYAVTVQTQPAAQICTVAMGTGTTASANIGNVVVTCAANTHSVGGTVSGLNTSGLVLANGSDTVSIVASATSFVLPTPIANGSTYVVTVATQPDGEACAVVNGTGTVSGAAVTNVAVTCTDQPFSLGGSISGLTSTGLVLANGSDTLNVSSGASAFTMPTAVDYASTYAVSVRSQPTGLTCTVSNASGIMPASAVTSVTVVCAPQSFALGGSISGLTGAGLQLTDGTDTLTLASGATSFAFPTPIAYGSPYAVTVLTPATGETCTVAGGTGTMPPAAVTSVAVTCAPDAYTVGGSISQLTTTGLVLINGSDTLSVAANATQFTMPTSVAGGSTYNIMVQTEPAGQTCTVSNGTGTVGTAAVTSVAVSCVNHVEIVGGGGSVSFSTPGAGTWTVPAGVTAIQVVALGGGGGGGGGSALGGKGGSGGAGAQVTATIEVTPGDTINYYVGGGGAGTTYTGGVGSGGGGGGGGGSTNVIDGAIASTQIIAGAGGGGGGAGNAGAPGGGGGAAGTGVGGNSGAAGTAAGVYAGGTGGTGGQGTTGDTGGSGGTGATAKNAASSSAGGNGSGNSGGTNGSGAYSGGGGGGGGYGGGTGGANGGGDNANAGGSGGGGGGGSLVPSGASVALGTNGGSGGGGASSGSNGGNGSVVINILQTVD